jgi:hypothetical protein
MLFSLFIIAMYRYNKDKVNIQKQMIEKFIQKYDNDKVDPTGYSREDFAIYSKIMGIFKHKLGKSPSSNELFMCYEKIKSNEITFEFLEKNIDEHGEDYKTYLFPELNYTLVEAENVDSESDNVVYEEDEDANLVSEEKEKPMTLTDDVKNQYILHRPTIYNISNKIAAGKDFSTDKFIKAVKDKVKKLEENDDDIELDMDEEYEIQPKVDDVESKEYPNRCGTKAEMKAENILALKQQSRNMAELESGCKRSTKREKLAHEFDDMVLRHDQLWKMPQGRPPVCTMDSKKKCSVNPIEVQSALLGTLLDDNTTVGSILPKFSFKEK